MHILRIVVLNTDRRPAEVIHIVVQLDEENAIITIYIAAFSLNFLVYLCPKGRFIRPVALPFTAAPWVAQLQQFYFLSFVHKLVD